MSWKSTLFAALRNSPVGDLVEGTQPSLPIGTTGWEKTGNDNFGLTDSPYELLRIGQAGEAQVTPYAVCDTTSVTGTGDAISVCNPTAGGSYGVVGVNASLETYEIGDTFPLTFGFTKVVPAGPVTVGLPIKSAANGAVIGINSDSTAGSTLASGQTAGNYANQPANDKLTVVSDAAGDTTQTVTVYGIKQSDDSFITEVITLNGVTPVDSVQTYKRVHGFKVSATTAGTITIAEKSGGLAITTIANGSGVRYSGYYVITAKTAYNAQIQAAAGGASSKYVGIAYCLENSDTVLYAEKQLNGATAVTFVPAYATTLVGVFVGDVATGGAITFTAFETPDDPLLCIGKALDGASHADAVASTPFWAYISL